MFRVQKHVLGSPSLSQGRPPGEAVDRLLDWFFFAFQGKLRPVNVHLDKPA